MYKLEENKIVVERKIIPNRFLYCINFIHCYFYCFYCDINNYFQIISFPTVSEALYIENNQIWYKYNNITIEPEGFCSIKAQNDGTLKTEDFAMMTTLPRLYSLTKDGKCYLKPSKRGLFNTTMKYIFGREYEVDGIKIMCRKTSHNLYLIITSDKILNQTLKIYSKHNYSLLEKQFNITNKNYFENFEYQQLPEYGKSLYNIYLKCISQNKDCENEWDIFEQYYWLIYFLMNM